MKRASLLSTTFVSYILILVMTPNYISTNEHFESNFFYRRCKIFEFSFLSNRVKAIVKMSTHKIVP